jgi:hypothetical protein
MKKFIAPAILTVAALFICVGIYNFPKGERPIFSSNQNRFGFSIDVAEIVHRFSTDHSKYDYKWTAEHYKNGSKKIIGDTSADVEWEISFGPGRYIPQRKCTCPEDNHIPWAKFPKEMHPNWKN